jgi:hypothetical protein
MIPPISASGIKSFSGCRRRWGFKYLSRLPDPAGASAELGVRLHSQLEAWLKRAEPPSHPAIRAALPHCPKPGSCRSEHRITFQTDAGAAFQANYDAVGSYFGADLRPEIVYGTRALAFDLKTTGNFKYALLSERGTLVGTDGKSDPQATIYAEALFRAGASAVTGKWLYVQSRNGTGVKPVSVDFSRGRVAEDFDRIEVAGREMMRLRLAKPDPNDLEFDDTKCRAYGVPCPFLEHCKKPERSSFLVAEEEDQMGFKDDLQSLFASVASEVPEIPDAPEAPELPEAPPEAPEPEPAAGWLATESGFVNPPETASAMPVACATPEELAEKFGDGSLPKSDRRFTKKDRNQLLLAAVEAKLVPEDTKDTATTLAKILRKAGISPDAIVEAAEAATVEPETDLELTLVFEPEPAAEASFGREELRAELRAELKAILAEALAKL